ncbi:MAG: translation elongation factor Ts [Clostridiales bacterium]|jgi:elongation factor Ts|nr:translation elongation factor Ts [Clostridiales bacterium]
MAVTAALIKDLRERTGAGMVDCKNALTKTDGDIDGAIEVLREKGLAAAAKKAGRIASEGLVYAYLTDDNAIGVLVEVNSETDFVAKNELFRNYVIDVAKQAASSTAENIDDFFSEKWLFDGGDTVRDSLNRKISVISENLNIRRFTRFKKQGAGAIVSYIHGGGRVAVIIELACEKDSDKLFEAGKNLCMQIAAMSPRFVARADISQEFIDKEKEILTQLALNEGKPANIVEKIIAGRLDKELKEFCLLEQEYVKDSGLTVSQYIESVSKEIGALASVRRFERYETGEGLEKRVDNFAEEVNKAIKG